MFDRVMVGIDESTHGRDAIALARQLVSERGEISFVHVHAAFALFAEWSRDEFEASERARAQALLNEAIARSGIDAQCRYVGAPTVGQGLHVLAEADRTDLLVVGSDASARPGHVWLHDATRQAWAVAPSALAIAPCDYAEHPKPLRELGVAFNDSPESHGALAVARDLAAQAHATVSRFEAVGPSPDIELARYSRSVDLLLIGVRGCEAVGRATHASVTRELARRARSPLLILTPAGARDSVDDAGMPAGVIASAAMASV